MTHRTLIAYASRAGSTAEVAETVGDVLRERGIDADVRSVKDVAYVVGYDSVILGSAIWAGKPLPEMRRFLTDHRDAVAHLPVAYFIQCDLLREGTPANLQIAQGYVMPLRKLHEPISVGLFAGRRDFSKAHPLLKWVLTRVFKLAEGDWRDWEQIRAWAAAVAAQLTQGVPRPPESGAATPSPVIAATTRTTAWSSRASGLGGSLGAVVLGECEQAVDDDDDHDRDAQLGHAGDERQDGSTPEHQGEEVAKLTGPCAAHAPCDWSRCRCDA